MGTMPLADATRRCYGPVTKDTNCLYSAERREQCELEDSNLGEYGDCGGIIRKLDTAQGDEGRIWLPVFRPRPIPGRFLTPFWNAGLFVCKSGRHEFGTKKIAPRLPQATNKRVWEVK